MSDGSDSWESSLHEQISRPCLDFEVTCAFLFLKKMWQNKGRTYRRRPHRGQSTQLCSCLPAVSSAQRDTINISLGGFHFCADWHVSKQMKTKPAIIPLSSSISVTALKLSSPQKYRRIYFSVANSPVVKHVRLLLITWRRFVPLRDTLGLSKHHCLP